MGDGEGFLFTVPVFLIVASVEIFGKSLRRAKFYKYGVLDLISKLASMACAFLIYTQVANGAWYILCLVLYFVCMALSAVCAFVLRKAGKVYEDINSEKNNS